MFFCEECPIKKKRKKEVDQFRVGEVKDVVSEEDVLFKKKKKGTTIQIMFKFGCEFLLWFSSLHIYKCGPYFGSYLHMHAFSLFSLG